MKTAVVKDSAVADWTKKLERAPELGYSRDEFRYQAVLRQLTGARLIICEDVIGAVRHYTPVLAPDLSVVDHHAMPIGSKVFCVPTESLEDIVEEEGEYRTPTEEPPYRGLLIVRAFTPWVDGFAALQRPKAHKLDLSGDVFCPQCGHLLVSGDMTYSGDSINETFCLCHNQDCRYRFVVKHEEPST